MNQVNQPKLNDFFFRRTSKWSGSEDLFKPLFSFPLDIYPEVGLLDHMAVLFLIFWGLSIPLFTVAAPIYGRAWSWPNSSSMPQMGPGQQQLSPLTSPHLTPSGIKWPQQEGDVKGTGLLCLAHKSEVGFSRVFLTSQGITDDKSIVIPLPPDLVLDVLWDRMCLIIMQKWELNAPNFLTFSFCLLRCSHFALWSISPNYSICLKTHLCNRNLELSSKELRMLLLS